MTRMFTAYAVARIAGGVTLAMIVLVGPVLKKRQKQARKIKTHASGNGTHSIARNNGKPMNIAMADTRKYDPGKRLRSLSPAMPPSNVAARPATVSNPSKIVVVGPATPRYSFT